MIVSGGVLFLAFPKVYAASLSGLYLGLFAMLWLLIGRGLSLELRGARVEKSLERSLDGVCIFGIYFYYLSYQSLDIIQFID